MKRKGFIKNPFFAICFTILTRGFKISIFIMLCMFMLASASYAFTGLQKSSKKECALCHVMWLDVFRTNKETLIKWQPGNVLMKNTQGVVSSEEMCYSCHDGYVADSRYTVWDHNNHPTFVKPSKNIKIPETFPLSNKGEIYCGTCHSPHSGEAPTPGAIPAQIMPGPLLFLRAPNVDSSMCEQCHKDEADYKRTHGHPVHTAKLEIPETLFKQGSVKAEKKNTVICQTCHKVHGAKGSHLILMDNSKSELCMACHKERTITGTPHDLRLTMPDETNIKGESISKSGPCGACHVPHNSSGFKLWARKMEPGKPVSQVCLSCHSGKPGSKIKGIGRYSHPYNVDAVSEDERHFGRSNLTDKLPFFSQSGVRQTEGRVQCFTCHNPHQWDPDSVDNRGGKDVEGDGSNSFLRISCSQSSALCVECHQDKQQILSYDHNLVVTAPEAKNIQGETASVSGPCGACHIPHNASGPKLWARKLSEGKELLPQYCVGCHNKNGPAKEKSPGDHDHPVDVASKGFKIAALNQISRELPLFAKDGGMGTGEMIRCITCHNPHIWDPQNPGLVFHRITKNVEGTADNSFLRKSNVPLPELCGVCHPDQTLVQGTDHDLSVTAPKAKNLLGQTVAESGICGACHLAHNSPNALKLWARPYGPIAKNEHPMDGLCTSCHAKGRIAQNTVPLIASHPAGKLVENLFSIRKEGHEYKYRVDFGSEALKYTPLFDNQGNRVKIGNISCPSCHNAHQWSASLKEKGTYRNVGGNATSRFLRELSYKNICVYCHGSDALFRYLYFHDPKLRGGSNGAKDASGLSMMDR